MSSSPDRVYEFMYNMSDSEDSLSYVTVAQVVLLLPATAECRTTMWFVCKYVKLWALAMYSTTQSRHHRHCGSLFDIVTSFLYSAIALLSVVALLTVAMAGNGDCCWWWRWYKRMLNLHGYLLVPSKGAIHVRQPPMAHYS